MTLRFVLTTMRGGLKGLFQESLAIVTVPDRRTARRRRHRSRRDDDRVDETGARVERFTEPLEFSMVLHVFAAPTGALEPAFSTRSRPRVLRRPSRSTRVDNR
jgi:hypothetical protein